MADIDGDENDNTLNGTSSADNIQGNGGQDTLDGGGGDDVISGGTGNDSIDGGSNNDTIYGGDGDDTITGGAGDDVIVGGRGDDVMTAGSSSPSDTFVIRDGDGNDTITDFDPFEPDTVRFDMSEMSTYQDVLDRISTDGSDTVITYDNGSTLRLQNVDPADLSSTNFQFGSGPVCLGEGTLIQTPSGLRPIETLRAGELVVTADNGPRRIVEIVCETILFRGREDRRRPVLISKGAIHPNSPTEDMVASPQHRIVVQDEATGHSLLVPAVRLINRHRIRRMKGVKKIRYYNLLMDQHEIIFANGTEVETLLVTKFIVPKLRALGVDISRALHMSKPVRTLGAYDPAFVTAPQF